MLGEVLRKARKKAGLTQEELAFKAGISREYGSMLEGDKKSPTVETLFRVCKALGVRPSSIIAKIECNS